MANSRQLMKRCGFDTAANDPLMRIPNEANAVRAWDLFMHFGAFLDYDGQPFQAATKLRPVPPEKVHAATAASNGVRVSHS